MGSFKTPPMKKYSLQVHDTKHSKEECIFNPEVFGDDVQEGSYVQIYDPEKLNADKLVLRVPMLHQVMGGRLEVSLAINIADAFSLQAFSRVVVEPVDLAAVELDFVEVTFKKQYLQRGNMWRYKQALAGLAVHVSQNLTIDGVSAQMLELVGDGRTVRSGVITNKTNIIFRSRSARIFWLVQISSEMWAFDQNGDLYFEKVLSKFISPVLDKWKALSVTHSLTIVFFTRSVIIDGEVGARISGRDSRLFNHAQLSNSFQYVSDGVYYQDFYKVVAERVADMEKTKVIQILKKEFLDFPNYVGWKFAANNTCSGCDHVSSSGLQGSVRKNNTAKRVVESDGIARVPSDAANGNFLEAVNTTLNILEKHYMDRDLQRTGGGIVVISAGTGIFKVEPVLAQISKQRMMDTGYGIDFISVSSPPLHSVPLFMVMPKVSNDTANPETVGGFFEIPHWMNTSFVDCVPPNAKKCTDGAKKDHVDGISRGGMEINRPGSKIDRANMHKWTGIREFQQPLTGKMDHTILDSLHAHTAFRAWQANKMEGLSAEGRGKRDAKLSHRWARNFRPLPYAEVLEAQAKVINDNKAGFVDMILKNSISSSGTMEQCHVASCSVDSKLVVLKASVSSAMRQNYESAYLHVVSLSGPLVNILMHPDLPELRDKSVSQSIQQASKSKQKAIFVDHNHDHDCGDDFVPADTIISVDEGSHVSADIPEVFSDSNMPIPEWGSIHLNKVLCPYISLSSICRLHQHSTAHSLVDSMVSVHDQSHKHSNELEGDVGKLVDSLPRPHFFEISSSFPSSYDGLRPLRAKGRDGTPPVEEQGSGSYAKYMLSTGSYGNRTDTNAAQRRIVSNCSANTVSNGADYGVQNNSGSNSFATGKFSYRGPTYGSNASLNSLNSANTGLTSRRSNRRGQQQQQAADALFSRICQNVCTYDSEDIISAGAGKEDILKQMAEFDEMSMVTNIFTRRGPAVSRPSSDKLAATVSQSESMRDQLFSRNENNFDSRSAATDHTSFYPLSKRYSDPVSQSNPSTASRMGYLVTAMHHSPKEKIDKVKMLGMSPRWSRGDRETAFANVTPSTSTPNNKHVPTRVNQDLSCTTAEISLSNLQAAGKSKASKPILIKKNNGGEKPLRKRNSSQGDLEAVIPRCEDSSLTHGLSGSHRDVLEFHRLQATASQDSAVCEYGSFSGSYQKSVRRSSGTRGRNLAAVSELTFLIPGDLADGSDDSARSDASNEVSMSSSLESCAYLGESETPPVNNGTPCSPNHRDSKNDSNSQSELHRKDSWGLSVSPGNRIKSRYSIGDASVMLENDAMARMGICGSQEKRVKKSDDTTVTPPDDMHAMNASRHGSRPIPFPSYIVGNSNSNPPIPNYSQSSKPDPDRSVAEFNDAYRKRHMANPFQEQEGKKFIMARTHNRRRWSHVFSDRDQTETWQIQHALNMKSLCQPAILPITTDYLPPIKELEGTKHPNAHFSYERQSSYTSSHYSLILDPTVCAYSTPEHLLKEMVGQRLTQEFQLITGVDVMEYRRLIPGYLSSLPPTVPQGNGTNVKSAMSFQKGDTTATIKCENDVDSTSHFYVLSMGHRIQFLAYNPSKSEVKVSRYVSTGIQTAANYEYELWVPQLQQFQRITQTFRQFPEPEYNWNVHDEILLGNLDVLSDTVRPKRLRFGIIPDFFKSVEEFDAYYHNFKELLQFLQKTCADGSEIRVERVEEGELLQQKGMPSSRQVSTSTNMVKLWMTAPPHDNPKWFYVKHDLKFNPMKVFHIDFYWITGDSWALEDFINSFFRRGSKLNLKLVNIPEYFVESNLQVHPFRAQPFIPVTLPSKELKDDPCLEKRMKQVSMKARALVVEKDVLIDHPASWIRDDDRKTDWNNYGQFDPETESLLSSPKPIVAGVVGGNYAHLQLEVNNDSSQLGAANRIGPTPRRTLKRVLDRQYYHRTGLACVRVAPSGGFVWLLNSSARVTASDLNVDERRELANELLQDFQENCWNSLRRLLYIQEESNSTLQISDQEIISTPPASILVDVKNATEDETKNIFKGSDIALMEA